MFRTMQTSSAACALYAVGAPAEAVALWASGAPRSALQLQEMGWSPGCGPSPKARHCPSLAMASSWCWAGDVVGTGSECPSPERGEAAAYENVQRGPLIQKLAACVCVCVCVKPGDLTLLSHSMQAQPLHHSLGPGCSQSTMSLVQEWPGWTCHPLVLWPSCSHSPPQPHRAPHGVPAPERSCCGCAPSQRQLLPAESLGLVVSGAAAFPVVRREFPASGTDCSSPWSSSRGGAGGGQHSGLPENGAHALAVRCRAVQP